MNGKLETKLSRVTMQKEDCAKQAWEDVMILRTAAMSVVCVGTVLNNMQRDIAPVLVAQMWHGS